MLASHALEVARDRRCGGARGSTPYPRDESRIILGGVKGETAKTFSQPHLPSILLHMGTPTNLHRPSNQFLPSRKGLPADRPTEVTCTSAFGRRHTMLRNDSSSGDRDAAWWGTFKPHEAVHFRAIPDP
jgi:hypothetical protein